MTWILIGALVVSFVFAMCCACCFRRWNRKMVTKGKQKADGDGEDLTLRRRLDKTAQYESDDEMSAPQTPQSLRRRALDRSPAQKDREHDGHEDSAQGIALQSQRAIFHERPWRNNVILSPARPTPSPSRSPMHQPDMEMGMDADMGDDNDEFHQYDRYTNDTDLDLHRASRVPGYLQDLIGPTTHSSTMPPAVWRTQRQFRHAHVHSHGRSVGAASASSSSSSSRSGTHSSSRQSLGGRTMSSGGMSIRSNPRSGPLSQALQNSTNGTKDRPMVLPDLQRVRRR